MLSSRNGFGADAERQISQEFDRADVLPGQRPPSTAAVLRRKGSVGQHVEEGREKKTGRVKVGYTPHVGKTPTESIQFYRWVKVSWESFSFPFVQFKFSHRVKVMIWDEI